MKIHELRLSAVGPFTGLALDLSGGQCGFHLIYGPNEAGKSSMLRAIRYLLFGFPQRLNDDFLHPYPGLRVGATIHSDQGASLCFTRRKAAQKSLRDGNDDAEVDEALLRRCLGNADEDLFLRCFGINHATLVAGGQEIVRGEGELGRLLFSGSGVAHLRELDSQLEKEARDLFVPASRAQNPTINRLLRDLRDIRKEVREQQLRPLEWERHYNALRDALRHKEQLEAERGEKRRQRDRLQRFHAALPTIAEYLDATAERDRMGDATLLSPDFNVRREETLRELGIARSRCESVAEEIAQREAALARIEVDERLLTHGDAILAMEKHRHRYEDSQADRPGVAVDLRVFEQQAIAELRKLGESVQLEQASDLILPVPERARIQQLAAEYERLFKDVLDSRRAVEQLAAEADEWEQQLAAVAASPDPQPLSQLLSEVQSLGEVEVEWDEARQTLQREQHEAACELRRLPGWSGTLDELETTAVPALETVERFVDELRDAEESLRCVDRERDDQRRIWEDRQQNLDELQAHQEVPTETQLRDLREERDRAWRRLRSHWRDRATPGADRGENAPPESPDALPQEEAYEHLVARADTLSDRLRHEADRVAKHAQLQAEYDRAGRKIRQLEQQRQQQQAACDRLQDAWRQLWQASGVQPLSPREMRAWLNQYASLLDRIRKIHDASRRETTLRESIGRLKQRLADALTAAGALQLDENTSLSGLFLTAQRTLEGLQETANQRRDLSRDLARCRKGHQLRVQELAAAEARLADWRKQWQAAVARLPQGSRDTPEVARQVLEILHELSIQLTNADRQRSRLQEIDDFSQKFESQVRELVRQAAPELPANLPVGSLAAALLDRYRRVADQDKERRRLSAELLERRTLLEQAHATVRQQQNQLAQLCLEANCQSPDELPGAWQQSERRRQLDETVSRLRLQLRESCGTSPLESFMQEARTEDPDGLPLRISQLEQEIQQIEDHLVNEIGPTIGGEENSLKRMDSSGRAAEAEEQARDIVASLSVFADQYARLRIAQAALRYGIDRYRNRHQGPVLAAAGELFSRLTDGAFQGLKVDYDPDGKPTVMGVRAASGELVHVSGMSDGTADQLYLALRCAWLTNYLESHESLPFVVDDILMRFDDQRAVQTLRVLGDLSRRVQVLFFTHHRHLVDFAQHHLPADVLFVHPLSRN